jgi:hypothetical protein
MNTSAMLDNELRENPNDDGATDSALNLNKIWDDGHLVCYLDDNQKKRWRCLWCNENYAGWHATNALIHF